MSLLTLTASCRKKYFWSNCEFLTPDLVSPTGSFSSLSLASALFGFSCFFDRTYDCVDDPFDISFRNQNLGLYLVSMDLTSSELIDLVDFMDF